jgi:hypothetical protein
MGAAGADFDYLLAADDDVLVSPGLRAHTVNEDLGSDDHGAAFLHGVVRRYGVVRRPRDDRQAHE